MAKVPGSTRTKPGGTTADRAGFGADEPSLVLALTFALVCGSTAESGPADPSAPSSPAGSSVDNQGQPNTPAVAMSAAISTAAKTTRRVPDGADSAVESGGCAEGAAFQGAGSGLGRAGCGVAGCGGVAGVVDGDGAAAAAGGGDDAGMEAAD